MDAFAVQNMLRNCRGLPPQQQQQQQQQRKKVVEEEDSEDSASYSSSSDASEDSDLTNDHEYDNNNHTHPSTVRKTQVFKSNPVPSGGKNRHPNSAFTVMTPRKQHQQQQNQHHATTPSTVHMSHGYHSPSSTIKTPDHDPPPGLANFPKIPNRPPPHAVSVPPTPGSLAEALGMKIDPDADETAYIREEGEAAVPIMPFNENCSAVKYHTTGVIGSAAPRPGSLAEALGLMIDTNPDASYIRKQGEAPTPIMPWNENCSAVKYHTTSATARPRPGSLAEALNLMIDPNPDASYIRKQGEAPTPIMPWNENCSAVKYHTTSATARPRPGSLAEALNLMIDPNPDASYIRKKGAGATPIMPWNGNCSAVKYHTTTSASAQPRPGSLAEALGLMIDPNPDASYIRKQGSEATPIMPWNEKCSAVKYHTTLPSSRAAEPRPGSLAEALGLMIDPNPDASYIRKQGEAATPIMPWNENCSAVKYHTTLPSGGAAPRKGSLAEALGLMIDSNPEASYIRKQGEAPTPIMPWNENCSAVKYHTTRPSGGPTAAPRPGSLAEALGLKIDPTPNASYIRKQGEAATPIMPWNENCSAVKYHTTRPTGGPTAAPRKGSLAEALGLKIDPSPEASYIRKQGEAATPIMPWNENCSAVKYHTTRPTGGPTTAAPRKGSLAEALGLRIDPSPEASYIRKQGEAPTPIMPWNDNCSAVKYHTTLPSGREAAAAPRPGSLAEALGLKIDPNPQASYIRKQGEAATPIMPWNENCSAVKYHTTLPSGQAAARPGSLAEALGLKIDPNPQASYIRKEGEAATPIMPWNENCSAVKYHTTLPSGQAAGPRPGSLAEALGLKIDPNPQASYIRKEGEAATPIMPWNENCSAVKYHTTPPSGSSYNKRSQPVGGKKKKKSLMDAVMSRVDSAQPGSLAAALGMQIDDSKHAAAIREVGRSAPPTQSHYGTTFGYSTTSGAKPKKSLMDAVMSRVDSAQPGSLAAALGMQIDDSNNAAAIREVGRSAPPTQSHYGTTFGYSATSGAKPKKSLMDAVVTRVRSNSIDEFEEENVQERADARIPKAKPKKSLTDAVVTRVRSNSIDEFEEVPKPKKSLMGAVMTRVRSNSIDGFDDEEVPKPKKSLMDVVMTRVRSNSIDGELEGNVHEKNNSVVDARSGSLADALAMKIDASYQAPAIREKGNRAPPVQTHYGTTFIGDQYDKSSPKKASFADMVFSRMEGSERSNYAEKQIKSERSAYSAPAPPSTPAATETLSSSPPPPVASIWMVADMTMKSRSKKQKKKKMSVP